MPSDKLCYDFCPSGYSGDANLYACVKDSGINVKLILAIVLPIGGAIIIFITAFCIYRKCYKKKEEIDIKEGN